MLVALLRADVERHAVRLQPDAERVLKHVHAMPGSQPNLRDSGHSAPTQSDRMRQNTRATRSSAGDLLDLGLAVDREQADAQREGARNVALLLDGVAIGDAVGRERQPPTPSRSRRPRRCRSRSRAWPAARAPPAPGWPSRRRTRACRATPSRKQCSCPGRRRDRRREPGLHRRRARGGRAETHGCAQSWRSPPQAKGTANGVQMMRIRETSLPARDGDARRASDPLTTHAALDWIGKTPPRPVGNDEQASTVTRAGGGNRQRR